MNSILQSGRVLHRIQQYNATATADDKIDISGTQAKPVGSYGYFSRHHNLLQFSGFGARDKLGHPIVGKIGHQAKTITEGQIAAKFACLNFVNNLAMATQGYLDEVTHINIRVDINCSPEFSALPAVADGASQLLQIIFGKFIGTPLRTASGSSNLANNMSVEISGNVLISDKLDQLLEAAELQQMMQFITWQQKHILGKSILIQTNQASMQKMILHEQLLQAIELLGSISNEDCQLHLTKFADNAMLCNVTTKEDLIDLFYCKLLRYT